MTDSKAQWLTRILLFGGSPGTIQTALPLPSSPAGKALQKLPETGTGAGQQRYCYPAVTTTQHLRLRAVAVYCVFFKTFIQLSCQQTKINMCQTSNLNKTSFFKDTCSR